MSHEYRLKYKFESERGSYKKGDATPDEGLTDALVLFSLIYPKTGEFSQMFISKDGRTGKSLSDEELHKVWVLMGKTLSSPNRKNNLKEVERAMLSFPYKMMIGDCKSCNDMNQDCDCGGEK